MRWRLLALVGCLLWALAPAGPAAAADGQATEQQVLAALNVDGISADYVILIDTSGSMEDGHLYQGVQNALRPLLSALSPKDFLSLATFDTTPNLYFDGPVRADGADALNRLPATADGPYTDIGQAIATGLDQLSRPNASQIGTLILMTDGQHAPGPNSAYPTTSGPAWTALAARATALSAQHAINAFALALRPVTDAGLLKSVFSQATVLDLPGDQIGSYLNSLKDSMRELKATALVSADTPTISVGWTAPVTGAADQGGADTTMTVGSNAKYVPLVVTGAALHLADPDLTATGLPATIDLAPGQTRMFPVHLTFHSSGGFGLGQHRAEHHTALTLSGQVSSPWAQVITGSFHLSPAYRLVNGTGDPVSFVSTSGWPWLGLILLPAGALLLVALGFGYQRGRQPRLRGLVVVTAGASPDEAAEYRLRGRRMTFGNRTAVRGTMRGARRRRPGERPEPGVRVRITRPARSEGTLWPGEQLPVGPEVQITYEHD